MWFISGEQCVQSGILYSFIKFEISEKGTYLRQTIHVAVAKLPWQAINLSGLIPAFNSRQSIFCEYIR